MKGRDLHLIEGAEEESRAHSGLVLLNGVFGTFRLGEMLQYVPCPVRDLGFPVYVCVVMRAGQLNLRPHMHARELITLQVLCAQDLRAKSAGSN